MARLNPVDRALFLRRLDELWYGGPKRRKAKLVVVCRDGVVVGEAMVVVAPPDPNWFEWRDKGGEIEIKPKE
jgi:hypothetical protein